VDRIFGVPGEENLDVLESLRGSGIRLVLTRQEQSAAFMVATHGHLTGRPEVCLATVGPGALNLTTGAAYAHLGARADEAASGRGPEASSAAPRRRGQRGLP
jgi:acetolactate synthase-1/2/3 large subunit